MALSKEELSKMLSAINAKNGKANSEKKSMSPTRRVDPTEKDAEYKAAAVINKLSPKLDIALKKKDPEAYDKFQNDITSFVSNKQLELEKKFKSGQITASDYKNQFQNIQKDKSAFIENYQYDKFLNPAEIKSALGKNYDDYLSAYKIAYGGSSQRGISKGIVGQTESPLNISDIMYGKRFMTSPRVTGLSTSDYAVEYIYDEDTGQILVDPSRSKNVDLKTGEPLIAMQKEKVKFVQ